MKLQLFRLLLISFLLLGNGFTTAQASPELPQACASCGTCCCCPELCAPKLDEAKKALGYCSTGEKSGRLLRGMSVSSCRITPKTPVTSVQNGARDIASRPNLTIVSLFSVNHQSNLSSLSDRDRFFIPSHSRDVPTPPPRILA